MSGLDQRPPSQTGLVGTNGLKTRETPPTIRLEASPAGIGPEGLRFQPCRGAALRVSSDPGTRIGRVPGRATADMNSGPSPAGAGPVFVLASGAGGYSL